jgi:hypothetical protein
MGVVEEFIPEVTPDDIRGTLWDFHHMRHERVEYTPNEVDLQTRALEDLLDLGKPEFYETVEIADEPWLLLVIEGAAHLVHVLDDEFVETRSIGSLDEGLYTEVTEADGTERPLVGTFTHPRLPGPIRINIPRRRDRKVYADLRGACRRWASRSARS